MTQIWQNALKDHKYSLSFLLLIYVFLTIFSYLLNIILWQINHVITYLQFFRHSGNFWGLLKYLLDKTNTFLLNIRSLIKSSVSPIKTLWCCLNLLIKLQIHHNGKTILMENNLVKPLKVITHLENPKS